jgi:hypothetical protein
VQRPNAGYATILAAFGGALAATAGVERMLGRDAPRSDRRWTISSSVPAPSRPPARCRVSASEASFASRSWSPTPATFRRRSTNVRRATAYAERSESSSRARVVSERGPPRGFWPRRPSLPGSEVSSPGRSRPAPRTTSCRRDLLRCVPVTRRPCVTKTLSEVSRTRRSRHGERRPASTPGIRADVGRS